jgi:primosomal protein N' (replication factor Y) (superfamily II helicase)
VGAALATRRLQVGREALTRNSLVARVVPDVSGIDKQFDYLVPPLFEHLVRPGAVVRVDLNGRRVDAWVVEVGSADDAGFSFVSTEKLSPLLDVADLGVDESVVPLAQWVSRHWSGPLRNVLSSATPVRKRAKRTHARRGTRDNAAGGGSASLAGVFDGAGGLLRVPPLESAMAVVVEAAARGTVLVLCPTLRMARLGAASLRRKGLTTAEMPDQVDAAIAGVDVVIGARSAVFAPCAGLSAIVVIDEHEESYHEERVPTWWAPEVAWERGRRLGVPVVLTSPVPSAASEHLCGGVVDTSPGGWPRIDIVNLLEVPVKGSLLSAELLESVRDADASVLCVLNTKGTARMLVCKACRVLQTCAACNGALQVDGEVLSCPVCGAEKAVLCSSCGRTALVNVRAGTARLTEELSAAASLPVVEVTASTEGVGSGSAVYVGTDALLHRVSSAGTVVFLDVDRDLSAPRMGAGREVLAGVARAARIVGRAGRVVIQTRQADHPVLVALSEGRVDEYLHSDTEMLRSLALPPFSSVAVLTADDEIPDGAIPDRQGIEWSRDGKRIVARCSDRSALLDFASEVRAKSGLRVRVAVNPPRV